MKTGNSFFESISGNKSSSRLIGFIIIMVALIYVGFVLWVGKENVIEAAISAGTLFLTLAGPAMYFLFQQKKQEVKMETE